MTSMELYADVDRNRAERSARRQARAERQERVDRVMGKVLGAAKIAMAAALIYAYLFFGFL